MLKRIEGSGGIFFAVSDRDWYLDGAAVHVSMVGFDNGTDQSRILNGKLVRSIAPNLAANLDITVAARLPAMADDYFEGTKKGARFELGFDLAQSMLTTVTPHGQPNSDIIRPYTNGASLYGGELPNFIIYFPPEMPHDVAARYEAPFEWVYKHVFPKYSLTRSKWWAHERPRPELISRLKRLKRYIAIVRHSKHRIFVWLDSTVLPDSALGTITHDDEFWFGVLQSQIHGTWALAQGTQVRERESGFRYTPTTCFETFPFPEPTAEQEAAIAAAATELETLRNNWVNPPEWTKTEVLEFPGSANGPWARYVHEPDSRGIGTVRNPRVVPKDELCATRLKKRTLTNLYNERPTWLDHAHKKLDVAVFAAYGWRPDMSDDDILAALLELNLARTAEK